MPIFSDLINVFLHLDTYLGVLIKNYGMLTYGILFFVIFMETGFVITPFLPGDSILFATGAFAAMGSLNIVLAFLILFVAAVAGDTINYWIGYFIGDKILEKDTKLIKKKYLDRTKQFYKKYGGITIVLARFVPIIRTFAPFVAGVGVMKYTRFIIFNVLGGFLWTLLFIFSGYFFGNITFVKNNFELVILVIIFISTLPMIIEFINSRINKRKDDDIQ